ncbi:Replicase polyprotein 1ab [Micromonospora globbae]
MAKPVAETVARHLVATGQLIDEDPAEALAHALAARRLASRIASVREAVGLAAYHAGEWQTAIAELRTYHRMTGLQSHLAVIADSERALGRPERAIDLYRGADRDALDPATSIELLIVAAGARGDLGQKDAAVAMLQVRELTSDAAEPWAARLRYAYADALLAVGRRDEAREWFSRAAEVDVDGETDAAERLLELDGVVIEGDDEDEESVEEIAAGPGAPGAVPARPEFVSGDEPDAGADEEADAGSRADGEAGDGNAPAEDEPAPTADADTGAAGPATADTDTEATDTDTAAVNAGGADEGQPEAYAGADPDDIAGRGGPDDPDLRARAGAEEPADDGETGPVAR